MNIADESVRSQGHVCIRWYRALAAPFTHLPNDIVDPRSGKANSISRRNGLAGLPLSLIATIVSAVLDPILYAGNLRILDMADLERNAEFLPGVPTVMEAGYTIDNSSVDLRGLMVRKATRQDVIDKLVTKMPEMFAHKRLAKWMKAGRYPAKVMSRAEVQAIWAGRQAFLVELLKGL